MFNRFFLSEILCEVEIISLFHYFAEFVADQLCFHNILDADQEKVV